MKRFIRPFLFLLAVSAILLLSDLRNRTNSAREKETFHIAVFRFNDSQLTVEAEEGLMEGLGNTGLYRRIRLDIKKYCAQGDMTAANTIALNILNHKFDMVVSISTPGLQVMANANKKGKILHVFCAVTDPYASGVGITGPAAVHHPPHLVGIGTFQPVEEVFRLAKKMKPDLKKVGVVWCASETCSEACVKKARMISEELGIELLEANVVSASEIFESAISVCAQGAEALWIGGDSIVEPVIALLVAAGLKFQVPVITNAPSHAFKGAMLNLGANYYQVGQAAAKLAIDLINGLPPTGVEIRNLVPERLFINDSIRKLMKGNWKIPDDLLARTDSIIR